MAAGRRGYGAPVRVPPLALLVLAASVLGVAQTWPAMRDPAHAVPVTRFTEGQFIDLALGARELPWPVRTELLGWPDGAGFAPLLAPMLPVAALVGPTVALNLVFAGMPLFNALCGWLLGRALALPAWGAFTVGGLCAWSPWTLATTVNGQLEQVPVGGAALVWAAAVWATAAGPRARLVVPGLAALAVGISAPHVGLAALVGLVPLGALGVAGRLGVRARWLGVAPFVALAAAGAHAWHAPQFGEGNHVYAPKGAITGGGAAQAVPGLFEVATPARLLTPPDPPHPGAHGVAHVVYLGWVPLAAAGWALARRRGGAWALTTGVLVVAALGEEVELGGVRVPLPAALYGRVSDALSKSANPYRLVSGAVPALAATAGFAAAGPAPALAVVGLAWAETALTRTRAVPLPLQPWGPEPAARALQGGVGPVLDLPLANPGCPDVGWHYAVQATFSDRPVPLTLRFDWRAWGGLADEARALERTLNAPDCAGRLGDTIAGLGFTAVVLHADARCRIPPRLPACLAAALGPGTTEGATTWWTLR